MSILQRAMRYLAEHRTQIAKFVTVGLVTFGINFLFFHVFFGWFQWDYRVAVSLAYVITVISHFSLHLLFTFSAAEQQFVHNAGKYLLMLALNYGMTLAVVGLVVEVAKLSPYIGVIASTAATASMSFFVMKYFVFQSKGAMWRSS
jgi:putative flippase GtrA